MNSQYFRNVVLSCCGAAVVVGLCLMSSVHAKPAFAQQNSPTPATVLAGIGTPMANGMTCGTGTASNTSTSVYDQRDILTGNAVWKCKLQPDGVTYNWVAPYVAATPNATGATVTIGGALLLLNSSVSGVATITGAVQGENCVATRSDGTLPPAGIIIDCAVTAANTVTVRLTALIAATPSATTYNVKIVR